MSANNYDYITEGHDAVWSTIQPWVEWKHISMGKTHCPTCLKLHKCWFAESNMPMLPQHQYCHCTVEPKSAQTVQTQATAVSALEKFTKYALDPTNPQNKGKAEMFESWGYTIADSKWMIFEYQRQAKEKYIAGDYELGSLNLHGQRVSIKITLHRKKGEGTVTFTTGWMVEAKGRIRLVTPYGGK